MPTTPFDYEHMKTMKFKPEKKIVFIKEGTLNYKLLESTLILRKHRMLDSICSVIYQGIYHRLRKLKLKLP